MTSAAHQRLCVHVALGLCRRADKGLGDRITTVRRAVVMLGLEAVQAAVTLSLTMV